ncbi:sugar MFS transporter [Panacibacter ginsenosidivorans]|uniref:Sugar MFS transporter n=1 Tax=Panacibacter ginsenosidivorans TaxID=1813871 RepID=A0A5B8V595_9BACT|nr:MFS transporter [Panacibacter ginsenosidivorans]QEC66554.1 sugar MFS transporter [Panacibacter ginsenosidivorans]
MSQQTKWSQFSVLIIVFFFWGFVAASNDILIPVFKEKLHLSQVQSQMVSFAFYVAYTVGSIIYFFVSKATGGDILNRIGFKNGISLGLIISALGTLLFYPAAQTASFTLMITGLFIVGLGFSLQQTAANPLAIVMGDPKTGQQRLSMAGGINNFGTTIGPLLVSFAIFGTVAVGATGVASIESVKTPYLVLGALFVVAAIIFKFSSVPNKIDLEKVADEEAEDATRVLHRKSVLNYPQLVLGMIAIFVYVGVEVSTASNLPAFLEQHLQISTDKIAPFISLYWASLMIGRWASSVGAFDVSKGAKQILKFLMPYVAFGVFLLVNTIASHDVTPFYYYPFVIVAMIIGDIMSKGNPARLLLIYSGMAIVALCIGIFADGMVSAYAFISVGLFCSTLWPCIFTLSIAGLGKHTNEGASRLIMMIMGGGFISILQGFVSDHFTGIQWSYIVGILCFMYLAFYAIRAKSILKAQGIDYDHLESKGGH